MVVFSLSAIPERSSNLDSIVPIILGQCDLLIANLVGYESVPNILDHPKIKINKFESAGSEIRFYDYYNVPDDCYYFTIDDDILYPEDYTERMLEGMSRYENRRVCCVHGSNLNLGMNSGFYTKRRVFHFSERLAKDTKVMIPGVGTSCFFKGTMDIDIGRYSVRNMSDAYTACFMAEQGIGRVSVSREKGWLKPLEEFGRRIYGNNPHSDIDELIRRYKDRI
jgi:hypothetical protein